MARDERVDRLERAAGELRHVGLGEHERARLAQLAHLKGIPRRHRALQRQRPGRGRHIHGVKIVLHDHGDAVQWPDRARLREPGVERVGRLQGVGINGDDRVQSRPLLVVRRNTVEIHLDQHTTGQRLRFERCLDVGNRRFVVMQQLEGARVHGGGEHKTNQQNYPQP